jgi:hypothetical protein
MKNKACHGKLQPQFIRSKPEIREVGSTSFDTESASVSGSGQKKALIEVISSNEFEEPSLDPDKKLKVKVYQHQRGKEHTQGTAVIELPGLKDMRKVTVKYGGDEIRVTSPVGKAHVRVPVNIDSEKSRHEFNPINGILTLRLRYKRMDDKTLKNWEKHGHDVYAYEETYGADMTLHHRILFEASGGEDSE